MFDLLLRFLKLGIIALLISCWNEDSCRTRASSSREALEFISRTYSVYFDIGWYGEAARLDGSERQQCEIPSVCSVQFKHLMISMTMPNILSCFPGE